MRKLNEEKRREQHYLPEIGKRNDNNGCSNFISG